MIGRIVDAVQGAPVTGAKVEVVDAPIRAVSVWMAGLRWRAWQWGRWRCGCG
jgi:hypothetical protein